MNYRTYYSLSVYKTPKTTWISTHLFPFPSLLALWELTSFHISYAIQLLIVTSTLTDLFVYGTPYQLVLLTSLYHTFQSKNPLSTSSGIILHTILTQKTYSKDKGCHFNTWRLVSGFFCELGALIPRYKSHHFNPGTQWSSEKHVKLLQVYCHQLVRLWLLHWCSFWFTHDRKWCMLCSDGSPSKRSGLLWFSR